jgi:hypothetical protein
VQKILLQANFTAIEIERVTEKLGGGSVEDVTEMMMQLDPLGRILTSADHAVRRAVKADIQSALCQFEVSGRVWLDAVAWLATAQA